MIQYIRSCIDWCCYNPSIDDDEEALPFQDQLTFEAAGAAFRAMQPSKQSFLSNRFEKIKKLQDGSLGLVWKVKDRQTNQNLVLKIFRCGPFRLGNPPEIEYQIHKDCSDHPNIIQVLEFHKDQNREFMSMEMGSVDLFNWLSCQNTVSERQLHSIFSQIVASVSHLHSKKIVHRDIKPENYILMDDGKTMKLTDFGLAKRIDGKGPYSPRGSSFFKSPEMVKGHPFDWATDHWSMGVLLYLSAYFHQISDSAIEHNIQQSPLIFPKGRSKELEDLIQKLLNRNPDQRLGKGSPCCQEILEHPWMKKYSSPKFGRSS